MIRTVLEGSTFELFGTDSGWTAQVTGLMAGARLTVTATESTLQLAMVRILTLLRDSGAISVDLSKTYGPF